MLFCKKNDSLFQAVDSGYFTTRRLTHINDTLNELMPRVNLLDPDQINLAPIVKELETLELDSKNVNRKVTFNIHLPFFDIFMSNCFLFN